MSNVYNQIWLTMAWLWNRFIHSDQMFQFQVAAEHEVYSFCQQNCDCKISVLHTTEARASKAMEERFSCRSPFWSKDYVTEDHECNCWEVSLWRGSNYFCISLVNFEIYYCENWIVCKILYANFLFSLMSKELSHTTAHVCLFIMTNNRGVVLVPTLVSWSWNGHSIAHGYHFLWFTLEGKHS